MKDAGFVTPHYSGDASNTKLMNVERFTSMAAYLRPVSAVTAGFIADRFTTNKMISIAFVLLLLCYTLLAFQIPTPQLVNIIYANLVITFIAVFGLRGIYFALLEENAVKHNLTGTTVGLVSLAAFTSDIFFAAITGRILDAAPGITGHQHLFKLLVIISAVAIAATLSVVYYR